MIFYQPGNSRGNFNYNAYIYTDTDYAHHFHQNMELIVPLEGEIRVTVEGKECLLQSGQMVLVLSNQIHSFHIPPDAKAWVAVFSEEFVPRFTARLKGKRGKTSCFSPDKAVCALLTEQMIFADCSVMMKKACFYGVCDAYLNEIPLEGRPSKSSFVAGQILDWIAEHYTQDISLKQAAAAFGYEYHYLSRLLSRQYRISFVDLVNNHRVEHAMQLLESTNLPVTEIMLQSGFQSIRSFNMVFRNLTGKTPSEYRLSD